MRRAAPPRVARWLALGLALASLGAGAGELARGDRAWDRRAAGERDGRPEPEAIRESIRAYESALDARPDDLEARWKLLRSLHFAGTFVWEDPDERRRTFERATRIAEEGLERLAERRDPPERIDELEPDRIASFAGPREEVARLYFWSALVWGSWSRTAGLLAAVREGVASRLHRYTQVTLALEPAYEDGGAYRLLGQLHAELPRVPFLTGWVDRSQALPLFERAHEIAPSHPGNQLLLAQALLDRAPERRAEALDLLERVASLEPRPDERIEDLAIRAEARERRAEIHGDTGEEMPS